MNEDTASGDEDNIETTVPPQSQSMVPGSEQSAPMPIPASAAADSEIDKAMVRWTRTVAILTGFLFLAALGQIVAALLQRATMADQLASMNASGVDTHNLELATENLSSTGKKQAEAILAEASAMNKLRLAGEAQSRAADKLRLAGEAQAKATLALADNSAKQIGALISSASAAEAQAGAARAQAAAMAKVADATALASRATIRQADAVLSSLDTAREANAIALKARQAADRPWVRLIDPAGEMPKPTTEYSLELPLLNSGRSPGLHVVAKAAIDIIDVKATRVDLPACSDECDGFTLFPSQDRSPVARVFEIKIPGDRITPELINQIKDAKSLVVVRTRVDYLDSDGIRHVTFGCSYLSMPRNAFVSCAGGNIAT